MKKDKSNQMTYDALQAKVQATLKEYTPEKTSVALDDTTRIKVLSPGMLVFKRFIRSKLSVIGIAVLIFMFLFCFVGALFSPYGESELFYETSDVYSKYATILVNSEYYVYPYDVNENYDSILTGKISSTAKALVASHKLDSSVVHSEFVYNGKNYRLSYYGENLVNVEIVESEGEYYTYSYDADTEVESGNTTVKEDNLSYTASGTEDVGMTTALKDYINGLTASGTYNFVYGSETYILNFTLASTGKIIKTVTKTATLSKETTASKFFSTVYTANGASGALASSESSATYQDEVTLLYGLLKANADSINLTASQTYINSGITYYVNDGVVTTKNSETETVVYELGNMKLSSSTGSDTFTLNFKKTLFEAVKEYYNTGKTFSKESDTCIALVNYKLLPTSGTYIKDFKTTVTISSLESLISDGTIAANTSTANYPVYAKISEVGSDYVVLTQTVENTESTLKVYATNASNYSVDEYVYAYGNASNSDTLVSATILSTLDVFKSISEVQSAGFGAVSDLKSIPVGGINTLSPVQGVIKSQAEDKSYITIEDSTGDTIKVYPAVSSSYSLGTTVYVTGSVAFESGAKVLKNAYVDTVFTVHLTDGIKGTVSEFSDNNDYFYLKEETGEEKTIKVVYDKPNVTFVVGQELYVEGVLTYDEKESALAFTVPKIYDPTANDVPASGVDYYITLTDGVHGETYFVKSEISMRLIMIYSAPSAKHWLGTDAHGMDVFTRIMLGGRISLLIGFVVIFFENLIGIFFGGISGFFGGWVDNLIMRIVDIFNCLPFMPIVIIVGSIMDFMAVSSMTRLFLLMVILGVLGWGGVARLVRGQILFLREQEFMVAAEATGLSTRRRIFKHLVPNVLPQLIVNATMGLGGIILTESTLSYLGLGVKYPTATWGAMINAISSAYALQHYTYIWIPIGLCIMITVIAFNIVGDGLRDAFDPRMKR